MAPAGTGRLWTAALRTVTHADARTVADDGGGPGVLCRSSRLSENETIFRAGNERIERSLSRLLAEVLRRSPVLHLQGNETVTLAGVRASTGLTLSAEATIEVSSEAVGIVFGPENGAVTERLVNEALREGYVRGCARLLVIGFAIEAEARALVEKAAQVSVPAVYVQATPDLQMGDLLKTMRSSQIFSVTGLPDVAIHKVGPVEPGGARRYQVELLGLDVFDPATMESVHVGGNHVPAWFLDCDWNDMSFYVSQAFFPRTGAWESLRKALKGAFDESVWDHLAGTTSAPFEAGERSQVAVKVIDDRGNELLVVKSLAEAV